MKCIRLAQGHSFPTDAVTQTFGFIARKGAGKTYAAMKLAEELYGVGAPFIVLDPVGNWWGLRVDADGLSPGLSVPVFGGLHGDLPLVSTAGALVAKIIVERDIPAVLDVSAFRKNERKTFVTEFAEELFHQAKAVRTPRMVIFEEAQVFAPQLARGEERMLGAVEDIVRLGRNYGLGSALLSQRPQSVNKEVLNQVECLLVGQLNAHHEREAIKNWIVEKGQDLDYVDELPSLPQGTMFLWSPQWLGKFERIKIAKKKTFDASATPKLGERLLVRDLAPVDIEALQEAMAAAAAPPPAAPVAGERDLVKKLRARIQELEAKLAEKEAIAEADEAMLRRAAGTMREMHKGYLDVRDDLDKHILDKHTVAAAEVQEEPASEPPPPPTNGKAKTSWVETATDLPRVERRMLVALAQHDPRPLSMAQVAIFAGYSPKTSSVKNGLGALRGKGFIMGGNDSMRITKDGRKAIGRFDPLPTGSGLATEWYRKLGKADRTMLQVIVRSYPAEVSLNEVAERAGYSPNTSSVKNGLGKLRGLHLIHGGNRAMKADESLIH